MIACVRVMLIFVPLSMLLPHTEFLRHHLAPTCLVAPAHPGLLDLGLLQSDQVFCTVLDL